MKKYVQIALLAILISVLFYFIKLPYYVNAPGIAVTAGDIVKLKDRKEKKIQGRLLLTTVFNAKANILFYLYTLVTPGSKLIKPDKDGFETMPYYEKYMEMQMDKSKFLAEIAALRYAGYDIKLQNIGVRVVSISPESQSCNIIKEQDIILQIDNIRIRNVAELNKNVRKRKEGDNVTLVIKRNNVLKLVSVKLIRIKGKTAIGIIVSNEFEKTNLPLDINYDVNCISGPSAGLVFSLEILHQMGKIKFNEKNIIAVTGAIDENGNILEVGGLEYKIYSGLRKGARIFIVPYENFKDISGNNLGVVIIPVRNLKEAVSKINNLK